MKLVSVDGGFGRVEDDLVIPMGEDLVSYLEGAPERRSKSLPLESVRLLAPVPRPGKILCIGFNYRLHVEEAGAEIPDEPTVFGKYANSVIGPGATIEVPAAAKKPDWEAELAVVIGRRARRVSTAEALDHVGGYACANDVSARDLSMGNLQWTRGKAVDSFLPLGPWLVTPDEVPDPQQLGIRCTVNDETVQSSTTAEMIWSVAELISFLSATITLEPGDLIATGTPAGVGIAADPPRFLAAGDEVAVEIDGLGRLSNPVAFEPAVAG